jgi:hypothetical protein
MRRQATPRDYLDAAADRAQDARDLYRAERFGGAIYLAGVSIECVVNAFLPSGHRLRGNHSLPILASEGFSQRLAPRRAKEISKLLTDVTIRWNNSQRYYPTALTERLVKPHVTGYRDAKGNAKYLVDAAYNIFGIGFTMWINPDDLAAAKRLL